MDRKLSIPARICNPESDIIMSRVMYASLVHFSFFVKYFAIEFVNSTFLFASRSERKFGSNDIADNSCSKVGFLNGWCTPSSQNVGSVSKIKCCKFVNALTSVVNAGMLGSWQPWSSKRKRCGAAHVKCSKSWVSVALSPNKRIVFSSVLRDIKSKNAERSCELGCFM